MAAPLVRLDALGFSYGGSARPRVLHDVALSVGTGERVAILGANGAGKTTLLQVLHGSLRPQAGEVHVAGERLGHGRAARLAWWRRAGLVLQDPDDQLFGTTPREDVAFGPANLGCDAAEAGRRAEDALAAVSMLPLADRPLAQLSVGERRRVAIAGVLAMDPVLLLCDEPTAGLDGASVRQLAAVLEHVAASGAAVVVATHDTGFALSWASRVVVLQGGRIVGDGPATLVLADGTLLRACGLEPPVVLRVAAALEAAGLPIDVWSVRRVEDLERALAEGRVAAIHG